MTAGTITFVAPVIRAALATLEAQLPALVAAFNADPDNTVVLDAPATYHFGATDQLSAFPFPQIEVHATSGTFGDFGVGRVEVDHDIAVNVIGWQEAFEGDVPSAYERAAGLCKVIIEALIQPAAFGPNADVPNSAGVAWRIDVVPDDAAVPDREFKKWRLASMVRLRLETVERPATS